MAMEAKADFINALEKRLSVEISADSMTRVMKCCADVLQGCTLFVTEKRDETDDLLECYLAALNVQGLSPKTITRYKYRIGKLKKYVQIPTRQITVYHLRAYLAAEKERGISDRTLKGDREIFCAYFNWLQRESLIDRNPTANLGTIKCEEKERKAYSAVELEKLIRSAKSLRDRAIIHFLGATGCRISEMTGLNRDAVDLEKMECVVKGKGKKQRTVYLDDVAAMTLKDYLMTRTDEEEALFIRPGNKRYENGGVRAMLKRTAKRAGVENVHPHRFRRTLATDLARHGMPIQEIASIMGHSKLDTTMKYVVMNKDDIKHSYRRYA